MFRRHYSVNITVKSFRKIVCKYFVLWWPFTGRISIPSFSSHSSTAVRGARKECGTVPEWYGWNEERTSNAPSLNQVSQNLPLQISRSQYMLSTLFKNDLLRTIWCYIIFFHLEKPSVYHLVFSNWENTLMYCFQNYILCRRGNKQCDVRFRLIKPAHFLSKMEKTRPMRKELDGKVSNSRQIRKFSFYKIWLKYFFVLWLGL